ncbi:low molecular weight protein-tyrosine-phosphatase [Camelliibacillus cellulosilyticus]|uniref:protein-tyrosine-phosphatase n=1 Tax=Camelliibacillus cellulosilyticus TaxID=2174486 RepID=A0ABV9GMC3_9BACL
MIKVLFVCLGNICRSPMAEAVFRHLVLKKKLDDQFLIDSAATGRWHIGENAHKGTLEILKRNGIDYRGKGRLLTQDDLARFDYIIAMDENNVRDILALAPDDVNPNVHMLLDFLPEQNERDIPDPYYTGRFDIVYDLIKAGSTALLDHILRSGKCKVS